jgi:hypothetical protein
VRWLAWPFADDVGARIIDLDRRVFKNFFTVVQEIRFFEEARHRSIEPIILFIIDPDPKSAKAYAVLRDHLSNRDDATTQLVAEKIIELAKGGLKNPTALHLAAIKNFKADPPIAQGEIA